MSDVVEDRVLPLPVAPLVRVQEELELCWTVLDVVRVDVAAVPWLLEALLRDPVVPPAMEILVLVAEADRLCWSVLDVVAAVP